MSRWSRDTTHSLVKSLNFVLLMPTAMLCKFLTNAQALCFYEPILNLPCRLLQRPVQLGSSAILSVFGLVDKATGSPQLATSSGAATQAPGQRPAVDNEEYDDPVIEEEENKQEVPVPAAAPVSTGAAEKELS